MCSPHDRRSRYIGSNDGFKDESNTKICVLKIFSPDCVEHFCLPWKETKKNRKKLFIAETIYRCDLEKNAFHTVSLYTVILT